MRISINPERGKLIAKRLHHLFETTGIHGRTDMPEDTLPIGVTRGSLEHILFLTLTVSIEALAELSNSVTPAKTGVQKLLKNLDSGFRRNDAQGLLQEAP